MATYNLKNGSLSRQNAEAYFKRLLKAEKIIELKIIDAKPGGNCEKYASDDKYNTSLCDSCELKGSCNIRTTRQNRYLHLILNYFCSVTGTDMKTVKQCYYKQIANLDIYRVISYDAILKKNIQSLKSSKDLTVEEMSRSIERFKNWSAMNADITLPDATQPMQISEAEEEIRHNKQYIF